MAKINFNQLNLNGENSYADNSVDKRIKFFGLKNDGDEAIVRIMHDSIDDLDGETVHTVKVKDWNRNVICLRDPNDPINKCPFCEAGESITRRIYIHLVEYSRDETGAIVAIPRIWDRSATFSSKIISLMNEYGPLSDMIFKIKRRGAAGYQKTEYDILPCNMNNYQSPAYAKRTDLFANVSARDTTIVLNKNAQEMVEYLNTGNFPIPMRANAEPQQQPQRVQTPMNMQPAQQAPQRYSNQTNEGYAPVEQTPIAPTRSYTPINQNQQSSQPTQADSFERPRRFYAQ